jgi:hypothetical protein
MSTEARTRAHLSLTSACPEVALVRDATVDFVELERRIHVGEADAIIARLGVRTGAAGGARGPRPQAAAARSPGRDLRGRGEAAEFRREAQSRMRFAELYPGTDEVRTAVRTFGSWTAIRESLSLTEAEIEELNARSAWRDLPAFHPVGDRNTLVLSCDTKEERDQLIDQLGVFVAKRTRKTVSAWWRPQEDLSSLRFDFEGTS